MSPLRSRSLPKKNLKKIPLRKPVDQGKKILRQAQSEKKRLIKKPRKGVPYPYFHLGIGVCFTLLFAVGIVFTSKKLSFLSEETKLARGQLVALQDYERALRKLALDLQVVSEEAILINRALPNEEGIVYFVRQFREIAGENLIEVFEFGSDQPSLDAAGNYYVDLSVGLKGGFNGLKRFLNDFTKLPYLIDLQIVDIAEVNREQAQMVMTARIYVDDLFFSGEE